MQTQLRFAVAIELIAISTWSCAGEPPAKQRAFFEREVRPVLVDRCYDCHSSGGEESGLNLESLAGVLRGGTRGPAIVPGDPDKSLLILAVNHADQLHMPPKTKIPAREIAALTEWVKMGAPWPDAKPAKLSRPADSMETEITDEQRSFWAFQRPAKAALPAIKASDWPRSPIDYFVLAKLEAAGLAPAPRADRRTLIRRVTFDLTGLPPTSDEVRAFLADQAPDAYARLIDRLLGSPRYGERWGRRWLDVARYADSNGMDENLAYANAFRYRDYVIAAFNKDKPFDRFVLEQLAGDLLPEDDRSSKAERLTATGLLCIGPKMLAEDDPVKMQMDIIDEQLDTVGRAFIGLTLGCARCHDHKFDPIPTADYYALAGIFKSTQTMENFDVVARWREQPVATPQVLAARKKHAEQIAAAEAAIDRLRKTAADQVLDEDRRHVGDYLLAALRRERIEARRANTTPLGNSHQLAKIPGLQIIEAEDFQRGNVRRDFASYGKDIGVLVNQGQLPNFVEYDVALPAAGTYQVELRYAAASSRPCKLLLNGVLVKSDAAAEVTGDWYPKTQTWFVEGFYSLRAGRNVIRLEHPQFFPHIDKLLLAPAREQESPAEAGSDGFEPKPELISAWIDYLRRSRKSGEPVFALWHELSSGGTLSDSAAASKSHVTRALLGDRPPNSVSELARRYTARFRLAGEQDLVTKALRRVLYDPSGPFGVSEAVESYFAQSTRAELKRLRANKQSLEESLPKLPTAMVVAAAPPEDLRIHIRGSHLTLGRTVPRRFLRVLSDEATPTIERKANGRLELARWLTADEHPLTARVFVNRVWQGHFGTGLVRSPDNFGRLGERPTHPQLLDYLAVRFVEGGWSTKSLHRTIMVSSTYQMSTKHNRRAAQVDPENQLLWRRIRRRLEAEAVRDSLLAIGGSLDLSMGGSQLPTDNRKYVTSTANVDPVVYDSPRRSVYLPVVRSALYEAFQAFDFADPSVTNSRRETTTVAPQALFMMNSELVARQTRALARELIATVADDRQRVTAAFERVFGRLPTQTETGEAIAYVDRFAAALQPAEPDAAQRRLRGWQSLCRALLATNEFIYVE